MDLIPEFIYEDSALLAINKPAGLLSLPDGHDDSLPNVRSTLEPEYGRLWIVHRLDRETSGVMILARNQAAHRHLNEQFEQRQVSKTYHAIVVGSPDWDEISTDLPLRINVGRRKRTAIDQKRGKPSVTHFKVLERFGEHTLLEAKPETGRRHQIRAHLNYMEYPILSDRLYGEGGISLLIHRLALHAHSLTLRNSTDGQMITFKAPYPSDFDMALARCRELVSRTRQE